MEQFTAKIRKVGHSFAIIIPKNVITKCNLALNDTPFFLISSDKLAKNDAKNDRCYNKTDKSDF